MIVRGKLEHKDGGKVSLVAQDVQPFAPSEEEIEAAAEMAVVQEVRRASHMTLQIQLGQFTRTGLDDLRDLLQDHAGEAGVVVELVDNHDASSVVRRLQLGDAYRVRRSPALAIALEEAVPGVRVAVAAAATAE